MYEPVGLTIKSKEFNEVSSPLVLDLVSLFNLLKDDMMNLIDKAEKENWTPDELITSVEELI